MFNRRSFIAGTLVTGVGAALKANPLAWHSDDPIPALNPEQFKFEGGVTDEKAWSKVRSMFHVPEGFINLENGYFSPQPKSILAFHQKKESDINTRTSWFMRREQQIAIELSRQSLAAFLGCPTEELALTRNTTEAMNIVVGGYPWKAGDEVVIGNQDYGSMVSAYHQAAKRFGLVVKVAQIPLHPASNQEVVDAYASLITNRTRIVHVTHLINLSGQVVPVAEISDRAHAAGAEVVVDSAHAVAHLNFKISDLRADYVGASLHKWLCNPLGAGFLWMKATHIEKIYPLMADEDQPTNNIRKFEHQGTRPIHTLQTIPEAIRFHDSIGSVNKQQRLFYLMQYWTSRVSNVKGIVLNTPVLDPQRCGAIANVKVEGYKPGDLADALLKSFHIFTVAIDHPAIQGVRITPHIYNNLKELDQLVNALKTLAMNK